jgi:3-oxoacyl-[acyl-carrier protein] reductase
MDGGDLPEGEAKKLNLLIEKRMKQYEQLCDIVYDIKGYTSNGVPKRETVKKFGKVDILVNNAGITRDKLILRMTEEDWDAVLNINLKGTFNCTKAVVRHMSKQKSGKIVNIASVTGEMGNAGQGNYAASKAGVIGFTKTIAREFAQRGINVNAIAPTFVETPLTKPMFEEKGFRESVLGNIPLGRIAQPKDITGAVIYLASEASNMVTGHVLLIDGGWTAH